MAKKENAKESKPVVTRFEVSEEDITEFGNRGARHADSFKQDLFYKVTFGVLTKLESETELRRALEVAIEQREKYRKVKTPSDFLEFNYWQSYAHSLHMIVARKAEVIEPKSLSDFFTDEQMSFNNFQNLIEKAQMSKNGKMKKDGISYKALATYNVLLNNGNLAKTVREKVFRDCFTLHYCNDTLGDSAYGNARRDPKGHIVEYENSIRKALGEMKNVFLV